MYLEIKSNKTVHVIHKKKKTVFLKSRLNFSKNDYSINDELCDFDIPVFLQHNYINGIPPPIISSLRSLQKGLLSRKEWKNKKNCVVVAPTSGRKTLIAEATIAQLLEENPLAKAIYGLPFVALAAEKNMDLQARFNRYFVRPFYQNVGGCDFSKGSVSICTYEKAHSLLNISIENCCLNKIKLIIIDECCFLCWANL